MQVMGYTERHASLAGGRGPIGWRWTVQAEDGELAPAGIRQALGAAWPRLRARCARSRPVHRWPRRAGHGTRPRLRWILRETALAMTSRCSLPGDSRARRAIRGVADRLSRRTARRGGRIKPEDTAVRETRRGSRPRGLRRHGTIIGALDRSCGHARKGPAAGDRAPVRRDGYFRMPRSALNRTKKLRQCSGAPLNVILDPRRRRVEPRSWSRAASHHGASRDRAF